jgi:hypothetical protein
MLVRTKTFLCVMLLAFGGWLQTVAPNIELRGFKLALPEGDVLGVGFDIPKDQFFVQQLVLSTAKNGRGILSSRQLSSWSLKNHSMLVKRILDLNPRHVDIFPCGRVEVSDKTNRILLCSSEGYLEVLDADTLDTVGNIAYRNQYIYDFVVDELRRQVFVLSLRGDNSPHLTSYSLLDGGQQEEAVLPPTGGTRMALAIVGGTGQIAVAVDHHLRGGDKSDIYMCSSQPKLTCTNIALIDRISQFDLLGAELLAAKNTFADRKKDCLISLDLDTHLTSTKYCSPTTGVHYAVGVVDHKYVVAFTGIGKRLWWKEQNVTVENSFSIWSAGNPNIAAVAKDATDYGSAQSLVRIFASKVEPLFMVSVGEANVLYIYSIVDSK